MSSYLAPARDLRFVLHELLNVTEILHLDSDVETINQILEAAGSFASDVLSPLNPVGDREGCQLLQTGVVRTPTGFKSAYEAYVAGGWGALSADEQHGGQGLPLVVKASVAEIFSGANMAWNAYGGMTNAAYKCLAANGSQDQKDKFLPKLATGEWGGTMCLTEPHCGTDLGLLRTRAVPQSDGSFLLHGTKTFISGGDQDLTENVIHLVLARLPDAAAGTRGISLFIVPKVLEEDGATKRNAVTCTSVEHKMGIRGNATCALEFEGAKGWLVGTANAGLPAMFVMMNLARLGVGVNALSQAEAAYQKALRYARERLQGKAPGRARSEAAADPIIEHPDVRRMLLTQKAWIEGLRALVLWGCQLSDLQKRSAEAETRRAASHVGLLTPVIKAFTSDIALECASLAIQVHGGHGYIVETGVEQHLRDARIIPLYEGANGIQAMDLLGRKVLHDGGEAMRLFGEELGTFMVACAAERGMAEFLTPLSAVANALQATTLKVVQLAKDDPEAVGSVAADYLRLFGYVCVALMWARMARVSLQKEDSVDPFYREKLATARFYFTKLLPLARGLQESITAGAIPSTALESA